MSACAIGVAGLALGLDGGAAQAWAVAFAPSAATGPARPLLALLVRALALLPVGDVGLRVGLGGALLTVVAAVLVAVAARRLAGQDDTVATVASIAAPVILLAGAPFSPVDASINRDRCAANRCAP